jgi:Ca2+-binding RTX toxin-like protein
MSQSVVLNSATSGEVRISPDGTRIYNAGSDGVVRVYDTLTGDLIAEWQVGGSLGAMDLSPDGSQLVIFDAAQPIMYYVDIQRFGQVTALDYALGPNDGLIVDVAIFSNQTALVLRSQTDGGFWEVQTLNINLGTFTGTNSSAQPGAFLSRASNPAPFVEEVLISEPEGARIFRQGVGEVLRFSSGIADTSAQAIGGDFFAFAYPASAVEIRQWRGSSDLIQLRDSEFGFGRVRDMEFSANLEFFYVLGQSGGTIFTFRTSDWTLVNSFPTGIAVDDNATDPVTLLVDPRGQFLTAQTDDGFAIIENPDAPIIEGTIFPDQLSGTLFGDVIAGLDGDDTINAGAGADVIRAGAGFNVVDGGSNVDTLVISGNAAAYTITQISTGRFEISNGVNTGLGGSFDDLINVEFVQFDDQTIRLLPGTGVSVNFETANPAVYQTAMNAIRDFDGNALGGNGSWLRIGSADVNGDGDVDQILVNDAIGRFATVGTAPDGLTYFSDFSWAGETRVAGIYIDPLVAAGIVERFGPNDSQRRFQNDLQIENINRVLGADDYDNDGLQEVYFALTDGTAYLRAIMEFDGNIRYANYQSQQEVIDYLAANGFGQETWGAWFTAPSSGEASLMQARVELAEASGLGRADLARVAVTAGDLPLPVHTPAFADPLHAEFFG